MLKSQTIQSEKSIPSVTEFIGWVFIFACLNPWTSFSTNSMDSQPWAFISGTIYLLLIRKIIYPKYFIILISSIIFGITISIMLSFDPPIQDIFRSIVSYLSLIIIYIAFYNHLIKFDFPGKIFLLCGFSWIIFAFIEIVSPEITSFLSAQRTSEDRGLTSLAPEPTYFAIFLIFISWIISVNSQYKSYGLEKILITSCLLGVVFLAQSSMGIAYIIACLIIFLIGMVCRSVFKMKIKQLHIWYALFSLIFIISLIISLETILSESRVGKLYYDIKELGIWRLLKIATMDASISRRLEDSVLSVHAAIFNLGIPGGIDTFTTTRESVRDFWGEIFWYPSTGNKIMSWNGAILYELGIFGVIGYISIICSARKNNGASLTEIAVIVTLLIGAIPIAFPLVPIIFALWSYKGLINSKISQNYSSCVQS